MISKATFEHFGSDLERIYGVFYDEDEGMVECPECGEPILRCDWEDSDIEYDHVISEKIGRGKVIPHILNDWRCPVCGAILET